MSLVFAQKPIVGTSPSVVRMHRFLLRTAFAGAHVFAWIFVFQYFYLVEPDLAQALTRVALLYALSQVTVCLITPHAARQLRHGVIHTLAMATFCAAAAFAVLGASFFGLWGSGYISAGFVCFALFLSLYRALYWIPYEVETHDMLSGTRRPLFREIFIALIPLVAGLALATDPMMPVWLLFTAAAVAVVSMIPLARVTEQYEGFSWGYRETFTQLIEPENRNVVRRSFFDGVSGAALLFLWPIAVFLIVGGSYGMLGIILSITFLGALLMRGRVRNLVHRKNPRRSSVLDAFFAISPWLLRLVVATPLGVVLVDSYFYTTTPRHLGVDSAAFEQTSDGGSFVDEHTALKEMSLALGRLTMVVLAAVLALFVSVPIAFIGAFIAAGIASGLSLRN